MIFDKAVDADAQGACVRIYGYAHFEGRIFTPLYDHLIGDATK
jgi:hypothetical protein